MFVREVRDGHFFLWHLAGGRASLILKRWLDRPVSCLFDPYAEPRWMIEGGPGSPPGPDMPDDVAYRATLRSMAEASALARA